MVARELLTMGLLDPLKRTLEHKMIPFTNKLRKKVKTYIKNKKDIAPLIKDVDIQGEDFTNAIIGSIRRNHEDLSNTIFTNCLFTGKVDFNHCNLDNVCFRYARFEDELLIKHTKGNMNFESCYAPKVNYRYAQFGRKSIFCHTVWRLGSEENYKSNFLDFISAAWKSLKLNVRKSEKRIKQFNNKRDN